MPLAVERMPMWTPWPWASMVLFVGVLLGAALLVAGLVRRSAALCGLGIVAVLLSLALHIAALEWAANRQKPPPTRPAPATRNASRP